MIYKKEREKKITIYKSTQRLAKFMIYNDWKMLNSLAFPSECSRRRKKEKELWYTQRKREKDNDLLIKKKLPAN